MKRIIISLLTAAATMTICAKTFEIKVLNTPTINIGGKELSIGQSFDENAYISWQSESQAMKVLSDDNRVYVISPKIFAKYHARNFNDFLTSIKTASVRNDSESYPISVEDHRQILEGDFIMLDLLSFDVGWRIDENSYFEATVNDSDKGISFTIPANNHTIFLTRDFLNSFIEPSATVSLTIRYIEKKYNDSTLITDSMNIEIAPYN